MENEKIEAEERTQTARCCDFCGGTTPRNQRDGLTFQQIEVVEKRKGTSVFDPFYVPIVTRVMDEKWFCSVPCSLYTRRRTVTVHGGKYNVNPHRLNAAAKALRLTYTRV
jgi:hypothetical protein